MADIEKVKKDLKECLSASCRGFRPRLSCPYNDEEWDVMRDALSAIEEQQAEIDRMKNLLSDDQPCPPPPKGDEEQRWIPVSERLPDEYEAVEIWLKYDEYSCTAYWCNGKGGSYWTEVGTDGEKEFSFYEVSHWRKPKPPREG